MIAGVRQPGAGDPSAIGLARPASSWGRAIEVPGLGALNKGRIARVNSVSCAAAGSCAAGGRYRDGRGHGQGFVAVERHGRWGKAIEVPGLGTLSKGDAGVSAVSCASPGNCAAAGAYRDRHRNYQGFAAGEKNGRWGKAIEVPGLAALNKGDAHINGVSCASAGNCAAGGDYNDRHGNTQGFVVSEKNGVWGKAIEVPGLGALNKHGADVFSVSCGSACSCAAGGGYDRQGFVAVEKNGVWGKATEVPGLAALNKGGAAGLGGAEVLSVSCASAGSCAAGGDYNDQLGDDQGFVVSEKNGVWGKAIEVPGLGALNDFNVGAFSVSCASAGNCAAGGDYDEPYPSGFVAVEKNGVWGRAIEVPGLAALEGRLGADVGSVSCASAGNCAAGGVYADGGGNGHGFVAVEKNGVWGRAIEVPGLAALNKGRDAETNSVSCAPAGICAAGGAYTDRRGHIQGFVVSQTGPGGYGTAGPDDNHVREMTRKPAVSAPQATIRHDPAPPCPAAAQAGGRFSSRSAGPCPHPGKQPERPGVARYTHRRARPPNRMF